MKPIILASASETRARLLANAGLVVSAEPAQVDEEALKVRLISEGRNAREVAQRLATAKAVEVSQRRPGLVIGADQTLEYGASVWSKGRDLEDLRRQLRRLRGQLFSLHSGAALASDGEAIWRGAQSASLVMRTFSEAFLEGYLARNADVLIGSLGGFQLEAEGAQLFDKVDGDAFAILGLPLIPLLAALREHGGLVS